MTLKEKIELAESEVKQAELMVNHSRNDAQQWENKLDLRRETLANLKAQARPLNKGQIS